MSQGVGNKLELAVGRNDGSLADIEWLSSGNNFSCVTFLRTGQAELVLKPIDPIIRVDRTAALIYPNWFKEVLNPELENTGPAEYDGTKLVQFILPKQKIDTVTGHQICEYLERNNMLPSCLGLHDLKAIQQKGIFFFRQNWKGKFIFGCRLVFRGGHNDRPNVPYLYEADGEVVLSWFCLGGYWSPKSLILLFAS
ncbi:MAG: hypothetical protein NTU76_03325 [Candidatus Taylorbacteria bacterium]|nr:hypothetical protein [Candidatus Taylorbacteria bacterium]